MGLTQYQERKTDTIEAGWVRKASAYRFGGRV
jgi:hypothetical protein